MFTMLNGLYIVTRWRHIPTSWVLTSMHYSCMKTYFYYPIFVEVDLQAAGLSLTGYLERS